MNFKDMLNDSFTFNDPRVDTIYNFLNTYVPKDSTENFKNDVKKALNNIKKGFPNLKNKEKFLDYYANLINKSKDLSILMNERGMEIVSNINEKSSNISISQDRDGINILHLSTDENFNFSEFLDNFNFDKGMDDDINIKESIYNDIEDETEAQYDKLFEDMKKTLEKNVNSENKNKTIDKYCSIVCLPIDKYDFLDDLGFTNVSDEMLNIKKLSFFQNNYKNVNYFEIITSTRKCLYCKTVSLSDDEYYPFYFTIYKDENLQYQVYIPKVGNILDENEKQIKKDEKAINAFALYAICLEPERVFCLKKRNLDTVHSLGKFTKSQSVAIIDGYLYAGDFELNDNGREFVKDYGITLKQENTLPLFVKLQQQVATFEISSTENSKKEFINNIDFDSPVIDNLQVIGNSKYNFAYIDLTYGD